MTRKKKQSKQDQNGHYGLSRIVEVTHGRVLIKPYSRVAMALIKIEALEEAGLEEPMPPKRLIKSQTLPPRELEFTSLEELEGLEEDEEYENWVKALVEYQRAFMECEQVRGEAAKRLIYTHSFFPCDDDGELLTAEDMAAALQSIGLRVPDEPYELKRRYIECFLLGNIEEESFHLGLEATLLSQPQEEEVQAHLRSFLNNHRRRAFGRIEAAAQAADSANGDALSTDGSGGGGEGDGPPIDGQADDGNASEPAGVVQSEK